MSMHGFDRTRCTTRSAQRWRTATHHRLPLGLAIAIVALEWLALACSSADPLYEAPAAGQPCIDCNVILVSADTLRANHLGAYGYNRPTSPSIDAFAKTGVLFERARSQAPWTLPAHMSMLTSLYPTRHLVGERHKLSDDTLTLADILHDDGYRTVAFSAGGWITRRRNFHTFDIFDDSGNEWKLTGFKRKPASFVRMMEWLDDDHPEKFFLFWHTKQTHCPYEPAARFDEFSDPNYSGPIEVDGHCSSYYADLADTITEADKQFIIGKYDGTIRTLDDKFAVMLRVLERRGLAARTSLC
jgi:arylsulfatase A-like enzyme